MCTCVCGCVHIRVCFHFGNSCGRGSASQYGNHILQMLLTNWILTRKQEADSLWPCQHGKGTCKRAVLGKGIGPFFFFFFACNFKNKTGTK